MITQNLILGLSCGHFLMKQQLLPGFLAFSLLLVDRPQSTERSHGHLQLADAASVGSGVKHWGEGSSKVNGGQQCSRLWDEHSVWSTCVKAHILGALSKPTKWEAAAIQTSASKPLQRHRAINVRKSKMSVRPTNLMTSVNWLWRPEVHFLSECEFSLRELPVMSQRQTTRRLLKSSLNTAWCYARSVPRTLPAGEIFPRDPRPEF